MNKTVGFFLALRCSETSKQTFYSVKIRAGARNGVQLAVVVEMKGNKNPVIIPFGATPHLVISLLFQVQKISNFRDRLDVAIAMRGSVARSGASKEAYFPTKDEIQKYKIVVTTLCSAGR